MLARRFGVGHLETVEDAVQDALLAALESWGRGRLPDNPQAWLFRVAHNNVITALRQRTRSERLQQRQRPEPEPVADGPVVALTGEVQDDLLRMLFVCCDDGLPAEAQLVLALKTLCGFDVREIAERLFLTEANVYQRLRRARLRLRSTAFEPDALVDKQLSSRLPAVRAVLYLVFTEGYLSSRPEEAIRRELCDEAIRLTTVLAEHRRGATPETFALLALMHLHSARMSARQNGSGGLLLLEEQDRTLWDQREVEVGLTWLARAAEGDTFSRYHAEAGIAAEHCLAPSFDATRWDRIIECYEMLERLAPSALHTLNRAVAVAQCRGPVEGLKVLAGQEPPSWLAGSHLWSAVLSDLHGRSGNSEAARRYREVALAAAPSEAIAAMLRRRLQHAEN